MELHSSCKRAAEETLRKVSRNKKYHDQKLIILSEKSQKIRRDIESCKDEDVRRRKREERKKSEKKRGIE